MGDMTLPGHPMVPVHLRQTARARRITLRVSRLDGRVTLTLPRFVSVAEGRAFLNERTDWVLKQLGTVEEAVRVGHGTLLPVEGVDRQVVIGNVIAPGQIAAKSPRALEAELRKKARTRLLGAVDHFTAELGRPASGVVLRDTRSRWGSCSSAGRLMFSWRLILAPPEVLDYVAAHEVAHLKHMDHSAAFWATTEELWPRYRLDRAWLRTNGPALHRYQFDH